VIKNGIISKQLCLNKNKIIMPPQDPNPANIYPIPEPVVYAPQPDPRIPQVPVQPYPTQQFSVPASPINAPIPVAQAPIPMPSAPVGISPQNIHSAYTPASYGQILDRVSEKSYIVTFLLSLFLGMFGADRFYLGYYVSGGFKLLTLGGLGVWYLLDLLTIYTDNTQSQNGSNLSGYTEQRRIASIILGLTIILSAGGMFSLLLSKPTALQNINPINMITGDTGTSPGSDPNNSTPVVPNETGGYTPQEKSDNPAVVAMKKAVVQEGYSVKVEKVVSNPATTGDTPDQGSQYLRVDLSISNSGGEDFLPGSFFYRSSSNTEYTQAIILGSDGNTPGKRVTFPDRELVYAVSVAPGATSDKYSLLFQVPAGETSGQVVWREQAFANEGPRLGTFELN
jgi:TM2 domain-containing membrane protein YozV